MSSTDDESTGAPIDDFNSSRGSSVSSGLQNEYDELLKYAIITPKWERKDGGGSVPPQTSLQLQLKQPCDHHHQKEDVSLTNIHQYSESETTRSAVSSDGSSREDSQRKTTGRDSAMGSDDLMTDRKNYPDDDVVLEERSSESPPSAIHIEQLVSSQTLYPTSSHQTPHHHQHSTLRNDNTTRDSIRKPSSSLRSSNKHEDGTGQQLNEMALLHSNINNWHQEVGLKIMEEVGKMKQQDLQVYQHELKVKEEIHQTQVNELQK